MNEFIDKMHAYTINEKVTCAQLFNAINMHIFIQNNFQIIIIYITHFLYNNLIVIIIVMKIAESR